MHTSCVEKFRHTSQPLLSAADFTPEGCPDPPTGVASFRPMVEDLEAREKPVHWPGLPRGIHQKTYAGTDLWNARGMNLTQAVRAMLGDPFAYYESALFTVYKMTLLNSTDQLPNLVWTWDKGHWPTTEEGPWPQYKYFKELIWDIVPALADSGLVELGAGLSEAAAVCRAKRMLDHRFTSMSREDIDRLYLLGIESDRGEDPYDALYSSCYQGLTNEVYGPDVVVLAPDTRKRGVDLNFYQGRFCPHSHDYSEILTPGYRVPSSILGYLVVTWNIRSEDEDQFKGVEFAFFRAHEGADSYVLVLGTQELPHPVFCVDQHPDGHFVACVTDSIAQYDQHCSTHHPLPYPRLTNTTIPVIGVLYAALPESAAVPKESSPWGLFRAGQNAERRRKAQAVLARHRADGQFCNQTLRTRVPKYVLQQLTGVLSTDRTAFQVSLWTVDMADLPEHDTQPSQQAKPPASLPSRKPPLWIISVLCLGSVLGDLLGQRATRHHFKSTRRMILVSMVVSALLVLLLGGLAQWLFPLQTGLLVVRGTPVQCYRDLRPGVPGTSAADCSARPWECTPVACPAQGPTTIGGAIAAHPLLLLLGLLAIVYHVCEVVLHLHPLGILFKPLASFFATFLIVPLARLFGYWEKPIPPYVMLVGALGTYLCLYERKRGAAPVPRLELTPLEGRDDEERPPVARSHSLPPDTLLGTATLGDDFPVSEHYHENQDGGWKSARDTYPGCSETLYRAVESEEVEKHVLCSEEASLLRPAKAPSAAAPAHGLVGLVLLGGIFGVLVTSMSVWVLVQKLVNDRCRVNEFGFTALDQVLLPVYMGAFLWVCDWLPSGYRQLFLPDMHDQEQTLAQAARQAVAQCCAARGEAVLLVVVQRVLANARIAAFFWLSVHYNLAAVFFESTVLRVSLSWLTVLAVNTAAPAFISLAPKERFTLHDPDSRAVILVKGAGTVVVFLTLLLLEGRD